MHSADCKALSKQVSTRVALSMLEVLLFAKKEYREHLLKRLKGYGVKVSV